MMLSVRASPVDRQWGGPNSILFLGMNAKMRDEMAARGSAEIANGIYFRFIQQYATNQPTAQRKENLQQFLVPELPEL